MKLRLSFVTNSSSSSFTINKKDLTSLQITLIEEHRYFSEKLLGYGHGCSCSNEWNIVDHGDCIEGYTSEDNFNMREYLGAIGVNLCKVDWGSNY
jgi:hypothetical protein